MFLPSPTGVQSDHGPLLSSFICLNWQVVSDLTHGGAQSPHLGLQILPSVLGLAVEHQVGEGEVLLVVGFEVVGEVEGDTVEFLSRIAGVGAR